MTEFHNYQTPKKGETNWHVPLNDNFEQIDKDVEIRATESEKSAFEPKDGSKFFATDTGRVYVGDGENWNRLPESGQDPSLTQLNARTYFVDTEAKLKDTVENSEQANKIIITDDITISSEIDWHQLQTGTVIQGDGTPVVTFDGNASDYRYGYPISIKNTHHVTFRDLFFEVSNCSSAMIYYQNQNVGNPHHFLFDRCEFRPQGGGPVIDAADKAFFHQFNQCRFTNLDPSARAYVCLGGTHVQYYGCRFFRIPDGCQGIAPASNENGGGHGHLVVGSKFGGGGTGSGIRWRDSDTTSSVNVINGAVLGCTFERLNETSGSGEYGIKSGGNCLIAGNMYAKIPTFLKIGYSNRRTQTIEMANKKINAGALDYVIDASNANEAVVWSDEPKGSVDDDTPHNDPNNRIYGVTANGVVTTSPNGNIKREIGIDNLGNVVTRNI